MNSRERFLAALKGEKVDRPAVAHVAVLTSLELQEHTGCWMPSVHHDAAQQAALLAANHDVLGYDAVGFLINYFIEPAALGTAMEWGSPSELPMYRSHPWQRIEDTAIPSDILSRPPICTGIETIRYAKQHYGERMGIIGKVMGPFSMVQVMHGLEATMLALVEDPECIVAFMDRTIDLLADYANAQFAEGADAIVIGEGGAGAQMLSPAMYERYLLPVHQRLVRRIEGPAILHICGDIRPRLAMLAQTGIACFNFDWAIPPQDMVEAARGHFTVMGNINTSDLLYGTQETLEKQVEECLCAGVHIISPGCALSPRCPNRNLRVLPDFTAKWKKH
ncbi:MAG TPA: uroporphyrinogen decarboxylase family protein [Candidatus Hydrogenedentes bacterium]|nr:uroporphyrinogen decarboxylase family protein [Candidatus Hydrogenedentota bacterium]